MISSLPDLNVTEHIGVIIKDEVEKKCYQKIDIIGVSKTLKMHIFDDLGNVGSDIGLFETLCLYSSRLCAVKNANGCHTDC
jgi:hypothetical protein